MKNLNKNSFYKKICIKNTKKFIKKLINKLIYTILL